MSKQRIVNDARLPSRPLPPMPPAPKPAGEMLVTAMRRMTAGCVVLLFGDQDAQRSVRLLMNGELDPPDAEAVRATLDRIADRF